MIYGTAVMGKMVLRNTEHDDGRARGKFLPETGYSSIPVMAGDHKNMEIPIRHSNKPRMNGTMPIPEELFCWDCFEKYYKMTGNSPILDQ